MISERMGKYKNAGACEEGGREGRADKKLPLAARGGEGHPFEQISGLQACVTA